MTGKNSLRHLQRLPTLMWIFSRMATILAQSLFPLPLLYFFLHSVATSQSKYENTSCYGCLWRPSTDSFHVSGYRRADPATISWAPGLLGVLSTRKGPKAACTGRSTFQFCLRSSADNCQAGLQANDRASPAPPPRERVSSTRS